MWWVCILASQVSSLSRALFCICRVHLSDLCVRCGGRVLHSLAPLLGISHSSSGWNGGGCCRGPARCCRRCCIWGSSCCDGSHGCGTTLCRAGGGSLGGGSFTGSALSRGRNLSLISFLIEDAFLFHRHWCLLGHSDQFLWAPADGFCRRPKNFFFFLFSLLLLICSTFYPFLFPS